jgi:hypothetical protein
MPRWAVAVHVLVVCVLSFAGGARAATLPVPKGGEPIVCPYCDLRKANLAGRDLRGANLVGADLTGANLAGANLGGTALVGAKLSGADLRNAIFTAKTDLTAANLTNARLTGATLGGGIFEYTDVKGADLLGTDSSAAVFAPKPATTASARYYCGAKDTTELSNVRYVSPSGTDSLTCGVSLSSPCLTIQRGITNCSGPDCAVLVAYGEYKLSSSLLLAGAVSLYGGCAMLEKPDPQLFSLIRGPAGAPGVLAANVVARTIFQGFAVIAGAGQPAAGKAVSIAFASIQSSGVSLESVSLIAGAGAPFPDGNNGKPAPKADNGREQSPGISPGFASGGGGGAVLSNGRDGQPGDTGYRAKGGGTSGLAHGEPGREGFCRAAGTPSPDVNGTISSSFAWTPSAGGPGNKGSFGGGGGGGRGAVFSVGGGGGAGGEGGGGGDGGTQGGASIALLIVGGRLSHTGGAIYAGVGASGSRGGDGTSRGIPGDGVKRQSFAGSGGNGGPGGAGTGGAGGNGGPAFAVATAGTADGDGTFIPKSVDLYIGMAGAPGKGGKSPPECGQGKDGLPGVTAGNQRLESTKLESKK